MKREREEGREGERERERKREREREREGEGKRFYLKYGLIEQKGHFIDRLKGRGDFLGFI